MWQGAESSRPTYSFPYSDWSRGLRQLQEKLFDKKDSNWLITVRNLLFHHLGATLFLIRLLTQPAEDSMNPELIELKRFVSQSIYPRPSALRSATPLANKTGTNAGQTSAGSSRVPSPAISASGSLVTAGRADSPARTDSPAKTKVQEMAQSINKNQAMPEKKASWRSFWRSSKE